MIVAGYYGIMLAVFVSIHLSVRLFAIHKILTASSSGMLLLSHHPLHIHSSLGQLHVCIVIMAFLPSVTFVFAYQSSCEYSLCLP